MPKTITIGSTHVNLPDKMAGFARQETVFSVLLDAEIKLLDIAAWCPCISSQFISEQGLAPILKALVERIFIWTSDWPPHAPGYGYIEKDIAGGFLNSLEIACRRLYDDRQNIEKIFFSRYGAAYAIDSLEHVHPLNSVSHIQDRNVLLLEFNLKALVNQPSTIPLTTKAKLIYKPADVESDCFLTGDTTTLGLDGNGHYVYRNRKDNGFSSAHCPSVAEILNKQIGEDDAFPTYVIWPVATAACCCQKSGPYGYAEYLDHDLEHRTASNKKQIGEFYRCFGRLTALAYIFCLDDVHHQNVLVHRQRPYFIDLESSFTRPFAHVADTLIFDRKKGPLFAKANEEAPDEPPAPECLPHRLLEGKEDAVRVVEPRNFTAELQAGCLEGLDTLAKYADEILLRLGKTPHLRPQAMFTQGADHRELFAQVLVKLSDTHSYGDFEISDAMEEIEFEKQRRNWTRDWFGKVLADIRSMLKRMDKGLSTDKRTSAVVKIFKDELCKAARVPNFNQLTGEKLGDASEIQLAQRWECLCKFADYLSWIANFAGYNPGVEGSWDILPRYAAKPQARQGWQQTENAEHCHPLGSEASHQPKPTDSGELPSEEGNAEVGADCHSNQQSQGNAGFADYHKFGVPFHCRQIDDADLRDACGNVVCLLGVDNPPIPKLVRKSFFPEPIAPIIIKRLEAARHPGFQDNLLGQIAILMK
jgi:hypothetical protein